MYRALKAAQNEINESLLKFSDGLLQTKDVQGDPSLLNAVQLLHAKQDVQFRVLNATLEKILVALTKDSVSTGDVIPSLQPIASKAELKDVGMPTPIPFRAAIPTVQIVPVVPVVPMVPVTKSVPTVVEEEEIEEEVEDEIEVEEEEIEVEEDEEDEVEEWTYKGRSLFKDSKNTVYANEGGEVGDPIGTYDPVKNILKKLVI